ncbi:MAG: DUF6268 family outer membrane beta-barrel protein, partial [Rubripirellula sp.]|nr:DUF6268 family outer membrane beta-barrel protein [Rubripirellula sp.]
MFRAGKEIKPSTNCRAGDVGGPLMLFCGGPISILRLATLRVLMLILCHWLHLSPSSLLRCLVGIWIFGVGSQLRADEFDRVVTNRVATEIESDLGLWRVKMPQEHSSREVLPASADVLLDPENPQPPSARLAALSQPMCEPAATELELERFKRQALQSVSVEFGGVGRFDSEGLSNGFIDLGIGTGLPLGSLDHLLGITPRVRVDWLDLDTGSALPAGYGVPEELYQFELQFFYRGELNDRLSALAIISPAIRSDLSTDDRALRLFALGLLNWEWIPDRVTLSGGVVMLGRADLPVLPALGLLWKPNHRTKIDLRFPLAKAAYRLTKDGAKSETWAYVTGGLGGTTWAITRELDLAGVVVEHTDEFSLRDYRLILGWERLVSGGGGCFAEIGVAVGRRLEWERPLLEVELASAGLIQA